jgi:hypothetical protein
MSDKDELTRLGTCKIYVQMELCLYVFERVE